MNSLTGFGLPYWLDFDRPQFPRLDSNLTSDIVIIGAGISGLKLAHCLAKHGISSVILEANRVGKGASGRNQGTICTAGNSLYHEAIEQFRPACGTDARRYARDLWQMGLDNLRLAEAQMEELGICCDYQREGFHLLVRRDMHGWDSLLQKYRKDYESLSEDGFAVTWMDEAEAVRRGGNPLYAAGLSYLADAQFHSGRYVVGLAQGVCRDKRVQMFEQSRVTQIERRAESAKVVTPNGAVTAKHVFLLTNALVPQHVPSLADGMRAERGQVLATEPLTQRPCVGSFGTSLAWWRAIPEPDGRFRFLFGGGRRREEPDSLFRQFDSKGKPHPKLEREGSNPSEAHQRRLEEQLRTLFPLLAPVRVTHRWGGLQCFTADGLPMIGTFEPRRSIHGMAGFSGRGNTYTNVGAEFLAGKIAGVASPVEKRYARLIEKLLAVGRESARWQPWETTNE